MIHARQQQPQALLTEIVHHARGAERAPGAAALVGGQHAVAGRAEAAVEFHRFGDVSRPIAVVGGPAHAARVDELAVVVEQAEIEDALALGEEWALVGEERLLRAEVHHQVVAFDLAEIRIQRRGQLELPVRLPEDVRALAEVAAPVHVVVQRRNVRLDRQQRLAVRRHFDALERGEVARLRIRHRRPCHALAGRGDHAIQVKPDRAFAVHGTLHRRGVPRNQHLHRPALRILRDRVLPEAVPVGIEVVFVRDDFVVDRAGGSHREVVAGAAVAVEIDLDIDAIDLIAEIALHLLLRARHAGWLGRRESPRRGLAG